MEPLEPEQPEVVGAHGGGDVPSWSLSIWSPAHRRLQMLLRGEWKRNCLFGGILLSYPRYQTSYPQYVGFCSDLSSGALSFSGTAGLLL